MPPRNATRSLRRNVQSAAARAFDRACERIKDLGAKILRAPDTSLSFTELNAAVDNLSVLIDQAKKSGTEKTPGVWTALATTGGGACILALYGVTLRNSCASLTPDVSSTLRPIHASVRAKLSVELAFVNEEIDTIESARNLARGLLKTHVLRCHAALLSDAVRPLVTHLRDLQQQEGEEPAQRLSPHRRAVQTLAELLGEARDVLVCLREVYEDAGNQEGEALAGDDVQALIGTELASSGLLESWSRGVLLLAACEGQECTAAALIESFFSSVHTLKGSFRDFGALLASSPSLSFLLSSHVVCLCAALDGCDAYGLPPAAAPWSAPMLAPLLPRGGWAGAGPSGSACSRARQGHQLNFVGETSALYLASMSLWAWTAALREAAITRLGSPLRPGFFEMMLNLVADSDVPPPLAAALQGKAAAATARPAPPPSLRVACEAYLLRVSSEVTLAECAERMLASDGDDSWPALWEVLRLPILQPHVGAMCRETKSEAERIRLLAASVDLPPLNAVAVADICLRLTAAAWEALAGERWRRAPPFQARGQGAQREEGQLGKERLLRLSRNAAARMALDALTCAKAACSLLTAIAARTELPQRAVQLLKACWGEWLAWVGLKTTRNGMGLQDELAAWSWGELGRLLAIDFIPSASTAAQKQPTPTVAAAIAVGYLPCLTRLLERFSMLDMMQGVNFLLGVLPQMDEAVTGWQLLLGFGPQWDVAQLLDILLGLVRKATTELPRAPPLAAGTAAPPVQLRHGSTATASSSSTWEGEALSAEEGSLQLVTALRLLRCGEGLLFCYCKSDGAVRLGLGGLAEVPRVPTWKGPAARAAAASVAAVGITTLGDDGGADGETAGVGGGGVAAGVEGGGGGPAGDECAKVSALGSAGGGGGGDESHSEGAHLDACVAGASKPGGEGQAGGVSSSSSSGGSGPAVEDAVGLQADAGGVGSGDDGTRGETDAGGSVRSLEAGQSEIHFGSGALRPADAPAAGAAPASVDAGAAAAGVGGGALGRPFGIVMSRVAGEFLPAFADLFRGLMPLVGWGPCTRFTMLMSAGPLLCWVPVLCVLASAPPGGAASVAVGGPAGAAASASGESEGVGEPATLPARGDGKPPCDTAAAPIGVAQGGGAAAAPAAPAAVAELAVPCSWEELLLRRVDALGLLRGVVAEMNSSRDIVAGLLSAALDPVHDAVVALAAFLPQHLSAALKQQPLRAADPGDGEDAFSSTAWGSAAAAMPAAGGASGPRLGRKRRPAWGARRASLFDGLALLFGDDGSVLASQVVPLLRRLRDWKEEEGETLEDLIKDLPPRSAAAQQQQDSVAAAFRIAARAGAVAPPPPHLRAWLEALQHCGVLDIAKLTSWRDGAALLPAGPPGVIWGVSQ